MRIVFPPEAGVVPSDALAAPTTGFTPLARVRAHCDLSLRRGNDHYRAVLAMAYGAELPDLQSNVESLLHPNEILSLQGFRFGRRRASYLLGRVAAKRAVSTAAGIHSLQQIDIASGVFGQPVVKLACANRPDVSISHCQELGAAVAFPPEHPMSIDIERCARETAKAAGGFFSVDEIALFASLAWDETVCTTAQWSAKEALSKIMKFGLTVPPEILAISAVEAIGASGAVLRFRNFMQYKCHVWLGGEVVLSLVLPARTELVCNVKSLISLADRTAQHDRAPV